jgi:DNA processing protein
MRRRGAAPAGPAAGRGVSACDDCLRRTDLIAGLAGRIGVEFKSRQAPRRVLALRDDVLLALGPSSAARRFAAFDPAAARERAARARLRLVCGCSPGYPAQLRELADPPAVLHVLGESGVLRDREGVAVVGARAASAYGLQIAHGLGRGLSAARVAVVSGLALGIDSAAHAGALEAAGATVGVLAGSADVPYPARGRRLHAQVAAHGAVVSEMPPGTGAHRWMFVARNRIIAALAAVTVVVQATARSGSLTTADFAAEVGRGVGAVPGPVTTRLSEGTHGLIQAGAALVTGAADALELLADATGRPVAVATPPEPPADLVELLRAIEDGAGALGELAVTPEAARAALAGLGRLERLGFVRRGSGGRWERTL